MKVLTATVKYPAGKLFNGKRGGQRQDITLVTERGEEAHIWFDAGDRRYVSLQKGEVVQLLQEGEKFTLITDDGEEAEQPPTTPQATPAALASTPPDSEAGFQWREFAAKPPEQPRIKGLITTDDQTRTQIYQELCKRAQVLKSCHVQVTSLFTDQDGQCILDSETVQKYAVTLYIDLKEYW
jgi:hypothetical protein